jgi:hypothetical protein
MLASRPALRLPTDALLHQLCDASVAVSVKAFTRVFLTKAFARQPEADRHAAAPRLLAMLEQT